MSIILFVLYSDRCPFDRVALFQGSLLFILFFCMPLESTGSSFVNAIQSVWAQIALYLPRLGSALLVLIVGLIIAYVVASLVRRLLGATKIDAYLAKNASLQRLEARGVKFELSNVIAQVVKWFFVIVMLIAVSDVLGIPQLTQYFQEVALYLPNVLIAIVILGVGVWLGGILQQIVRQTVLASHIAPSSAGVLAGLSKWAIVVFAILAALVQLEIAPSLIQILLTGLVAMAALAGGLAFGLGGREQAAKIIEDIRRETKGGAR